MAAPFPFDFYYSLQHYGAALLGRIFGAEPGTAYNLGICLIVAGVVTAGAGSAWLLTRRLDATALLTVVLLFGGTGVSPFIHLLMRGPQLHSSIRFIGSSLSPKAPLRPLGRWLVRVDAVSEERTLDLPVELFSYLVALGDYHPPLSGYLLLMLALLTISMIERGRAAKSAHVVLAATVPLTIPSNAWDFPLQATLVGGFLIYRALSRKPVDWKAVAAGGLVSIMLIFPFLVRFAPRADDLHAALRWVPRGLHTPPLQALLVFYPVLALLLLHLIFGECSIRSLTLCTIWLSLLVASEFLFVDDVYSGRFERFNTALKWWGWIYTGALVTMGSVNLTSPSRVCRWITALVLGAVSVYALDLSVNLWRVPKPHFGELDGSAWLARTHHCERSWTSSRANRQVSSSSASRIGHILRRLR